MTLRHRYLDADACHAVIDELDDDARSWIRFQLDVGADEDDGGAMALPSERKPRPEAPTSRPQTLGDAAIRTPADLGYRRGVRQMISRRVQAVVRASIGTAVALACTDGPLRAAGAADRAKDGAAAGGAAAGAETGTGGSPVDASTHELRETGTGGSPVDASAGEADGRPVEAATAPMIPPRGLELVARVEQPTEGPHLVEMARYGDRLYVANSGHSFGVYRLGPRGGIENVFARPILDPFVWCKTIQVHEPSKTLVCASDAEIGLSTFDLSDPESPVLRARDTPLLERRGVRDVHLDGDVLFLSSFDRGLFTATIDAAGTIATPVSSGVGGNVRFVSGAGSRLVAVARDRGLLVIDRDGTTLSVRAEVPLAGPPQDLVLQGDRAVVSLASEGAALYDVTRDPPELLVEVHPPAVVTSADVDGDALAVMTLTGAYLYDLSVGPPRLAGFMPSRGAMLQGRFMDGLLVVSNWLSVESYRYRLDGESFEVDRPTGVYFRAGDAPRVPLRNVGGRALRVTLDHQATRLAEVVLAPGATGGAELPFAATEAEFVRLRTNRLVASLRTYLAEDGERREPLASGEVVLHRRAAGVDVTRGRPAPGDPFPDLALADLDDAVYELPLPDRAARVIFYTQDCAAMWTELEDAAFLGNNARLDDGATAVMLDRQRATNDGWAAMWGIEDAMHGHYDVYAPDEVRQRNARYGPELYGAFHLSALPGAAAYPTDYLVDEQGVVVAVERAYRGAHQLR